MSGPEEEDFALKIRELADTPISIAVHLFDPYDGAWHWTAGDRGEIVGWRNALERAAAFAPMSVMSGVFTTGNSLSELRYAAALQGANTVLAINAGGDVSYGYNPLALLYLTILGYYVVPGSSVNAQFVANGVVLDVATGAELAKLRVESTGYTLAPGGFLDPKLAVARAKADGLRQLKRQFVKQLDRLPERQPRRERPQGTPIEARPLAPGLPSAAVQGSESGRRPIPQVPVLPTPVRAGSVPMVPATPARPAATLKPSTGNPSTGNRSVGKRPQRKPRAPIITAPSGRGPSGKGSTEPRFSTAPEVLSY